MAEQELEDVKSENLSLRKQVQTFKQILQYNEKNTPELRRELKKKEEKIHDLEQKKQLLQKDNQELKVNLDDIVRISNKKSFSLEDAKTRESNWKSRFEQSSEEQKQLRQEMYTILENYKIESDKWQQERRSMHNQYLSLQDAQHKHMSERLNELQNEVKQYKEKYGNLKNVACDKNCATCSLLHISKANGILLCSDLLQKIALALVMRHGINAETVWPDLLCTNSLTLYEKCGLVKMERYVERLYGVSHLREWLKFLKSPMPEGMGILAFSSPAEIVGHCMVELDMHGEPHIYDSQCGEEVSVEYCAQSYYKVAFYTVNIDKLKQISDELTATCTGLPQSLSCHGAWTQV